ncbi:hypothetical protein TWF481_011403 [Arthrobotrys musiformis]|uniref:Rab-GAP TBC domain-containing protein n=1 Tax=Arthrobotrys musiformis TaxID=47236 RepID=A0AAV9W0P3_9PEZI
MPTAILRARNTEHLNRIELKYHHFDDTEPRQLSNQVRRLGAGVAGVGWPISGGAESNIKLANKGKDNSRAGATSRSGSRPGTPARAATAPVPVPTPRVPVVTSAAKQAAKAASIKSARGPRIQRCETASIAGSDRSRRPKQRQLAAAVEKQPAAAASRRLVAFTNTRLPAGPNPKLMPMPMVMANAGTRTGDGHMANHGDPVMPPEQSQPQIPTPADYNKFYNINSNHQGQQGQQQGQQQHQQQRGVGIGMAMGMAVGVGVGAAVVNYNVSSKANSNSPTSQAFPPRRDSKKGSNPVARHQPPPPTSHPSDWPLDSSSSSSSSQPPQQPQPPRQHHQYYQHHQQHPSHRPPLQRQLSQPNAPSRRHQSPGRPPTAGSNTNPSSGYHDNNDRGYVANSHPHPPPLNSYRSTEHMSNASAQRYSPVPFENHHPGHRHRPPPPNGPTSHGQFQNSQPKGLRIRTGPTPPHTPSQNRGRQTPDQRFPTERNGRLPEESGMRSPIIQMPLAFNKIATSRQEQSRSSSPTTTRSPIESFHSSLPNIRPQGSRRPTVLREEVSPQERYSPRGTSESLTMSRHDEISQDRPSSTPRKPSPSPENPQQRPQSPAVNEANASARGSPRMVGQQDAVRSSVVTSHSATTTSASEPGDISGEMSVEDAIDMYGSDDDDWDPTEVPVIDKQKRTDSGTPLEGSGATPKKVSMKEDRMSRSGLADFLIKQREEAASPSSPTLDERGVSLVLENGINLEAELHDAQNNEWQAITDKRKSSVPTEAEITDDWSEINRPAPEDTPPRYPPMKPSAPRDRYGFRTETQYITAAEYNAWNGKYEEILTRRKKKWSALLKEAGLTPLDNEIPVRFPPRSQKVKRFVRKGIPPEWRGNAWWFYASGQKYINKNPGLYEKLVAQGAPTDSEAPELIERDLHRTHPDNIHFKPEQKLPLSNGAKLTKHKQSNSKIVETPIIQSLRRVLTAFALYVPRIGYCQSLNFWAGMLLLFMDEEKAFWMLYIITHQYLPGTHERSLEGSNIDQAVLMMAVKDAMPHVWAKISLCLDGTSVNFNNSKLPDITLCTASWLMSGFISNLPIESVLRVWDAFFYEGSKILFRVSLGLFKIAEPAIRAVGDPVEVFQIVQTTPRKCIDAGALMDLCFKRRNGYGHLSQDDIENRRRERKDLLDREKRANGDSVPRSSRDDMSIRKGFARELIEEGEDSVRRFRNFIHHKR